MLWLSIGFFASTLCVIRSFEVPPKCEPIVSPMCKNLREHYKSENMYNTTVYPNSLQHRNQEEAGRELHQFFPLVKVQCSNYLRLFLCTIYAPMCSEPRILPCRSLCEDVRSDCLPLMKQFGFDWPDALKCEKYPRMTEKVCFGGPNNQTKGDKDKGKACKNCLDNSVDAQMLKKLCENHDIVIVGKVLSVRGDRRVKFRVKQEIKAKKNIGGLLKKRLKKKRMAVKLSFPKKACVGKCKNFEKGKSYVVFLKVKKGRRVIYNLAGVVLYEKGMKIC